ncbi:MAG: trypsin-like peptidase domain-containing protein [Eubacterium sp.]|nr:trypsin-like peptidase domain-containing protein [Eubacterium sp.]
MEDFENKNNDSENKSRPEYYNPTANSSQQPTGGTNSGNYYTPPKSDKPPFENTTYHYSYTNQNNDTNNQNSANQGNSNYYTPPNNGNYQNQSFNQQNNNNKPPKKSKAGIIILIVLAVCLVIAGVALAVSALTGTIGDSKDDKNNTNQSQEIEDKTLSDSEDVPLKDKDNNYTVAGVAKNAIDSCVGITVYSKNADAYNHFFGYGQNNNSNSEPSKSGEGSGVLMSESNGKTYILTCAHVISDGDSFKVTLNDDTELDATMVGFDAQTDIGVLSVDKTGLQIADFADSENLVLGEQVVAIGCPGGLEFKNSVTSGYISALARPVSSSIGYDTDCIQTDAAINPGNSGGALFNMQGQVIGINSSKIASTEYEGMGFAVPSKTAVETANSLIKVGYVEGRAKIGITYSPITSFNNSNAIIQALAELGFKDAQGTMVISEISSDSDLASKGVQQYDMIVAINGETLTSTDIMTSILADSKPGDTVKLTIARVENNQIKTKEVDCKLIESKG